MRWIPVQNLEQPTALGNLCAWLSSKELYAYRNSEEELVNAFQRVPQSNRKEVCRQYDRCRYFMEQWEAGKTPKLGKDRIEVYHHDGYYWAPEGKHRICAAIQAGIDIIPVPVTDVPYTVKPLPPLGQPGHFQTTWAYDHRRQQWTGALLYLYGDFTRPFEGGIAIREYLGRGSQQLSSTGTEIVPKMWARYTWHVQRRLWRTMVTQYRVDVDIGQDLPSGKVWLAEVPLEEGWPNPQRRIDLFRRGRIRPHTCPELS